MLALSPVIHDMEDRFTSRANLPICIPRIDYYFCTALCKTDLKIVAPQGSTSVILVEMFVITSVVVLSSGTGTPFRIFFLKPKAHLRRVLK